MERVDFGNHFPAHGGHRVIQDADDLIGGYR
jgi:hypothetical protein